MGQPYDPAGRSSSNRRYKTKEEKADDDLKQLLGTSDVSDTETLRRSMHWRRKRESESAEAAFRGGGASMLHCPSLFERHEICVRKDIPPFERYGTMGDGPGRWASKLSVWSRYGARVLGVVGLKYMVRVNCIPPCLCVLYVARPVSLCRLCYGTGCG